MQRVLNMKRGAGIKAILVSALALILFSGCDLDTSSLEIFDYDLRETWVSTRDLGWGEIRGRLVIDYDTIKITGSVLPFNTGYTKGVYLKGYSEESSSSGWGTGYEARGTLFISDAGAVKSVPYLLWRNGAYEDMLTVGTASNLETFQQE